MLSFNNDEITFNLERCCQCGTCLAACKTSTLNAVVRPDGLYEIKWNTEKCTGCGECVEVCPAANLPYFLNREADFDNLKGIFIGRCRDPGVSTAASSGGIARTLLITLLNQSVADTAYCVAKSDSYPWAEGKYYGMTSNFETISNSMYLPILVNKNLKKIKNESTMVVVGTHCQLMGMERFYRKSPVRLIKIALLCKQQKTFEFTRFIAKRLRQSLDNKTQVVYRGSGWPGKMKIGNKEIFYKDAASLVYGKKLWMVPGCRFCGHLLGEGSDITLADPWGIEHESKDGKNLIFVRTTQGEDLLKICRDIVLLKCISVDTAKRSVQWKTYKQKQQLIQFYLKKGSLDGKYLLAQIADIQRRFYEVILSHVSLPSILLKILNHIPFMDSFIKYK